jgi:hypothetical protein
MGAFQARWGRVTRTDHGDTQAFAQDLEATGREQVKRRVLLFDFVQRAEQVCCRMARE